MIGLETFWCHELICCVVLIISQIKPLIHSDRIPVWDVEL